MNSITVKTKDGIKCFMAGSRFQMDDNGNYIRIELSDEEETQELYQRLMDDVKREEFDRNITFLIQNQISIPDKKIKNIQILLTDFDDNQFCEMNIVADAWEIYKHQQSKNQSDNPTNNDNQ